MASAREATTTDSLDPAHDLVDEAASRVEHRDAAHVPPARQSVQGQPLLELLGHAGIGEDGPDAVGRRGDILEVPRHLGARVVDDRDLELLLGAAKALPLDTDGQHRERDDRHERDHEHQERPLAAERELHPILLRT